MSKIDDKYQQLKNSGFDLGDRYGSTNERPACLIQRSTAFRAHAAAAILMASFVASH